MTEADYSVEIVGGEEGVDTGEGVETGEGAVLGGNYQEEEGSRGKGGGSATTA